MSVRWLRVDVISFIIPAYNEERLLPATLSALHVAARAIGEPYEVIVVDDASTDRTGVVARSHEARVVQVAHRQIAATRNAGAREATGDQLIFVDADTIVSEAVLRAAIRVLRLGAVGGGATVRFDGHIPMYAQLLLFVGTRLFRAARLAAGCFLFCTRRAFDAVGGFDEEFYGAEEIVMSNSLKRQGRFVVLREAVVTSGRRVRAHSGFEAVRALGDFVLHGPRSRRGLAIWYEKRREDPKPAP
jgi:glycosyltransferase involved in cell wall biosynthesis